MLKEVYAAAAFAALLTGVLPAADRGQEAATPSPAGTGCVAVMPAAVSGVEGDAAAMGTAVRDLFVTYLSGPALQLSPLDSRVRPQAVQEARQKGCGHLVTATLTRKRSGGGSNALGRIVGGAAGTAAWHIPATSAGAAVARGVGVGAAHAVEAIATGTRAKDELRIEWALAPLAGGRPLLARDEKLKASSDGEDLLTPLVQRAAEAIVEKLVQ
jgi:hypothetical protein